MSQLHHDRPVDENEAAPDTVPTQRPGDAPPSDTTAEEPRLTEVTDLAGLTQQAEATARAGMADVRPVAAVPARPGGRRRRLRSRGIPAPARRLPGRGARRGQRPGPVHRGRPGHRPADRRGRDLLGRRRRGAGAGRRVAGRDPRGRRRGPARLGSARLGELTASRTAREAEQAAAAQAQADADRLAAQAIAEAARPQAVLPVDGARLSSGFGSRWGSVHAGLDFAAPIGTPEKAAMDGVVLEAGPASGYGLAVFVQHHNGDVTVYGHMQEILVSAGQVVRAGDTIALLGNRGQSTGPHLHFEVRLGGLGGEKVDPLPYLRERGVQF